MIIAINLIIASLFSSARCTSLSDLGSDSDSSSLEFDFIEWGDSCDPGDVRLEFLKSDQLFADTKSGKKRDENFLKKTNTLYLDFYRGNSKAMKDVIELGVNVNLKIANGWTLLHLASLYGHLETLELLLKSGAVVSEKSLTGITPLMIASGKGHLGIVKLLIKYGADLNDQTKEELSAFHLASGNGHIEVVEFFITSGANLNVQTKTGLTPLHLASENGHLKLVELLIKSGANLMSAENSRTITPLHLASDNGHQDLVDLFIKYNAYKDALTQKGLTPLHYASKNGYSLIVKSLIESGADLNIKDAKGYSPLHVAVVYDRLEVVKILIDKGANKTQIDQNRMTLLHHAAKWTSNCDLIYFLIKNDVPIYARNGEQETALEISRKMKKEESVTKIIDAFVEIKLAQDSSPLTCSVCLESENLTISSSCMHVTCESCVDKVCSRQSKCPDCRGDFEKEKRSYVRCQPLQSRAFGSGK